MMHREGVYCRVEKRQYVVAAPESAAALSFAGLPENPAKLWELFWNRKVLVRLPRTPGVVPLWFAHCETLHYERHVRVRFRVGSSTADGGWTGSLSAYMEFKLPSLVAVPSACTRWVSGWQYPLPDPLEHIEQVLLGLKGLGRV